MRKILAVLLVLLCLTGCNYRVLDLQYNYKYAIIELPNGEIVEGEIQSWSDSESDSVCIRVNGIDYYTSTNKAVLMSEKPK